MEAISYIKKYNNLNINIGVEFDILITKDNKIICHHDNNLKRMTNINMKVCDMNYDDFKNIKIKNKYNIPLLIDVLDNFKNYDLLLDIEIKDNVIDSKLDIYIYELCKILKNFIIKSFNHDIINKLKINIPDIKIG